MLPNLLIVGAQKSGTTSLHRLLESHREIYFPSRFQEIHYFDLEENFRRGTRWYESLFDGWAGQAYCAQTSPLYMYEPAAAERIRDLLPEARILFILRQPVDRAYSHYWHEVRFGYEDLSFEQALAREGKRISRGFEERRHHSYLDRGRYSGQVDRFYRLFGRERCLVLLQDELRTSVEGVRKKVASFLDLSLKGFSEGRAGGFHLNRAGVPRSRALQRLRRRVRRLTPLALAIDRINLRRDGYPPMAPELRERLQQEMEPEIQALEELTGLDLGRWRPGQEAAGP
ncbi:MAG: sulfotransferase [Acidobacteria bacterium]|nr:sulfotransferase [Acidobacteriota bacterium]